MSHPSSTASPAAAGQSFDRLSDELEPVFAGFWARESPRTFVRLIGDRVRLAAKILRRLTGLQQTGALEVLARALRFEHWHDLSVHLAKACPDGEAMPEPWFERLNGSLVLLVEVPDEVPLSGHQRAAFEELALRVAELLGRSRRDVLDGLCARFFGATSWKDVASRDVARARKPLYGFVVSEFTHGDGPPEGIFVRSDACDHLVLQVHDWWERYEDLTPAGKRAMRRWAETMVAAQPGFLDGGLEIATFEADDDPAAAAATSSRFIARAEALIPPGFEGLIPWGVRSNRVYHRLLYLRMELYHDAGELASAVRLCTRQLKLNPNDNLGNRYVLPFILLQQGNAAAARHAATQYNLNEESGGGAAVIRAFCAYTDNDREGFERELAAALSSLPWLRRFLVAPSVPLPEGPEGPRWTLGELETFERYVWPAYHAVAGLRDACVQFISRRRPVGRP